VKQSELFPVSFGVSTKFYIEIAVVLLLTLHIYQEYCISYNGSVDILCSKVMVISNSKILHVFNFAIFLKSQKMMLAKYTHFTVVCIAEYILRHSLNVILSKCKTPPQKCIWSRYYLDLRL